MRKATASKMTIEEFYEAVRGDLSDIIERLEDIDIVKTFALAFDEDPSYFELLQSLEKNDREGAFRAAHTLKGISYNFGFKRLGDTTATICEKLREGSLPTKSSLRRLANEYKCVLRAIHNLKNSN